MFLLFFRYTNEALRVVPPPRGPPQAVSMPGGLFLDRVLAAMRRGAPAPWQLMVDDGEYDSDEDDGDDGTEE